MAAKKQGGGEDEAFALNLTPMIDVVFQLIIFFMCAMKFKTLEKKIEAYLPKDRGLAKTPERIDEKVTIKVVLRQTAEEGVPHFIMFDEDVGRAPGDNSVPRMPPPPASTDSNYSSKKKAYDEAHRAFIDRHIAPKIALVERKIDDLYSKDPTLPGQIDAGRYVRHEYVIMVLDAFIKAGMNEITFVGTPPPRPGN
jgi:biopolymer transport protein ExbD